MHSWNQGRIEVISFNSVSDQELRSIRIITKEGVLEKTFDQNNAYVLMVQAMQQAIESTILYQLHLKIQWKRWPLLIGYFIQKQ